MKISTDNFEAYNYAASKSIVEQFFWHDFADNYIEAVKKRIYQSEGDKKLSAQYTLYNSLLTILKMIAPIMPFITEEIYQTYFKRIEKDKSIHISKWPKKNSNAQQSSRFIMFCQFLSLVRKEKTQKQKPMNAECIISLDKKTQSVLKEILDDFKAVTNAVEIKEGKFMVEFV